MIGSRDGELTPAEAAGLQAHLVGCAGCRAFQGDLLATEGMVAQALERAAATRDFAPFVDGVMARVSMARPPGLLARLVHQLRLHPRLAFGGALLPIAAAALALFIRTGGGDLADAHAHAVLLDSEGRATTIIQSSDGPVLLLDDDDDGES